MDKSIIIFRGLNDMMAEDLSIYLSCENIKILRYEKEYYSPYNTYVIMCKCEDIWGLGMEVDSKGIRLNKEFYIPKMYYKEMLIRSCNEMGHYEFQI